MASKDEVEPKKGRYSTEEDTEAPTFQYKVSEISNHEEEEFHSARNRDTLCRTDRVYKLCQEFSTDGIIIITIGFYRALRLELLADTFKTARNLRDEEKFLTSGCQILDTMLKGGFADRGITQIYGAAGTGKTQFALQLCLTVQLPVSYGGYEAGAVYISTEGKFPIGRFSELLLMFEPAKRFNITGDAVYVEELTEITQLENCLFEKLPRLLASRKIGLLIIDSIAAPYRAEFSGEEMKTRAGELWKLAHQLHTLGRQYKMTIICINQVSASISPHQEGSHAMEHPTLGMTWANLVANNFHLRRRNNKRYLYAEYSSYLPRNEIQYQIGNSGVSGIIERA